MRQLARVDLLILDDWGPEPLTTEQRRDLLEIVEERTSGEALLCGGYSAACVDYGG